MKCLTMLVTAFLVALAGATNVRAGAFADEVISYTPGTTAAGGYTNRSAALGSPTRFTGGDFPGVVSPFSPPYLTSDIVSIGQGGQLTLRLSNYALTSSTGLQLGVFAHAGIADANNTYDSSSQAGSPLASSNDPSSGMFSVYSANVAVSADDHTWVSLGRKTFDIPTNGYTDLTDPFSSTAGSALSDFGKPFAGSLSSFAGETYSQMLTTLNGSGGGNWFDLSGTGLSQVGYIRFSLDTADHFELDAVSVANGFVGAATPEPATGVLAVIGFVGILFLARRRRWSGVGAKG